MQAFAPSLYELIARPLEDGAPGAADRYAYGSGVFFQYLSERFGNDAIRQLWQLRSTEDAPNNWVDSVDVMIRATDPESTFASAWPMFFSWLFWTGANAGGSPTISAFADAEDYPTFTLPVATAPYDDTLRIFAASAQGVRFLLPNDVQTFRVVVDSDDDLAQFAVLRVNGASGDQTISTVDALDDNGTWTFAAGEAPDEISVLLVDSRTEGDSRRVRLCVAVDDDSACDAALPDGEGDSTDDSSDSDADSVDNCDCATTSQLGSFSVAIAVLLLRRRRR
jgi:hypothetical protein